MAVKKKKKKISRRRQHVRDNIAAPRFARLGGRIDNRLVLSLTFWLLFVAVVSVLFSLDTTDGDFFRPDNPLFRPYREVIAIVALVFLVALAGALYVNHFEHRITRRPLRVLALVGLFGSLLALCRLLSVFPEWIAVATGTGVFVAIILTIAYNQRLALGLSLFYAVLACFAIGKVKTVDLFEFFLTMAAGVVTCCFSLREIRTRMKLIWVSTQASIAVFIVAAALGTIRPLHFNIIATSAGISALVTVFVGIIVQGFLPIIEQIFGVATSMTLLDYSDANQPLLKKLAMEAPGTFSHSLLIGSIAEAAAEAIGANGLLCRVGSYYHDVGKINKPPYFVENQMGSASRHEQLSPAMSQLVIVGHVKDGIEIAKEYGIPAVLRQFIETHHGTTLIEYFYNEARKRLGDRQGTITESEFRYPGPRPQTREAAIVMIADTCESAARSLTDPSPTKIETLVHNMAMKRLQDGQFDECDLTLKELSKIEAALSKALAAHHHGRIAYPKSPDEPASKEESREKPEAAGKPEKELSHHASD